MNPLDYTNHSGGAPGSDKMWDQMGREFGVIKHLHYRPIHVGNASPEIQAEIRRATNAAAEVLKRPTTFKGIDLVWRNWFQAENAEAIYAIAQIVKPGGEDFKGFVNKCDKEIVAGGTGWAVEMAIQKDKRVYVFDKARNAWYAWSKAMNQFIEVYTPTLTKEFAGIGSRELTPQCVVGMRDVYTKTFKS